MSDVVYFSEAHADLVDTLTRLVVSPHTTVICAHEFRHPMNERPFFDELLPNAGFEVQQVRIPERCSHPNWFKRFTCWFYWFHLFHWVTEKEDEVEVAYVCEWRM